jgi:hypothetical protein
MREIMKENRAKHKKKTRAQHLEEQPEEQSERLDGGEMETELTRYASSSDL